MTETPVVGLLLRPSPEEQTYPTLTTAQVAITFHPCTEIVHLSGHEQLARVTLRNNLTGKVETDDIGHIFIMIGATPNTGWLGSRAVLDPKGFIKTGSELSSDDLAKAHWPLSRAPHLLETSLPGTFALGDVRSGNVERVADAVGEGSIAVSMVHQELRE